MATYRNYESEYFSFRLSSSSKGDGYGFDNLASYSENKPNLEGMIDQQYGHM